MQRGYVSACTVCDAILFPQLLPAPRAYLSLLLVVRMTGSPTDGRRAGRAGRASGETASSEQLLQRISDNIRECYTVLYCAALGASEGEEQGTRFSRVQAVRGAVQMDGILIQTGWLCLHVIYNRIAQAGNEHCRCRCYSATYSLASSHLIPSPAWWRLILYLDHILHSIASHSSTQ